MNTLTMRVRAVRDSYARSCSTALLTLLSVLIPFHPAVGQTAPSLGTAQSFAVLGASTVTNTGPSIITGNLGVSPGTAVTGFPPGTVVGGSIHAADAVAAQAQADNTTAYGDLASEACNTTYGVPTDIGGLTLVPGVYCFSSSAGLTGTLTLNAEGSASSVWVFKIASTLITASDARVLIINGGQQCNVFWQVGSSATLGTGTDFIGNILALTSITLTTDASLAGRALAQNGAVTLDSNRVSVSTCSAGGGGGGGGTPVAPTLGKAFSPSTIVSGGVSTLTITLNNAGTTADSMTSPLTDTMPTGVVVSGTATTTCGGTPTAPSGGSIVSLTGGSIPAAGSCTITVPVTAPAGGNFINSLPAGALQTNNGSNAGPAVATLSVTTPANAKPSLGKAFSPASVSEGGTSTLTITLTNTSPDSASLSAPLIDHLPSGMEISGAGSDTCGGALTANMDAAIVTLTGGSIPADGSCTITVPVTTTGTGSYFNSIAAGALQTSNGSNTSPAVATLSVRCGALAPSLSKAFSPSSVKAGAASTVTITLTNPDATIAKLTAPLTDNLPSGVVVSGSGKTTCGGTLSAATGSATLTLSGGSIPAKGSCTITVAVTAKNQGTYINTLPAGALQTGNGKNSTPAKSTLTVGAAQCVKPTLSKSFSNSWVKHGASTVLTIELTNGDSAAATLTAPLTDHLPSGMLVWGSATTTCGGTLSAATGGATVTLNGGAIPANSSCKVTVTVTAKNKCGYTNTLPAGALQSSNGSNANAAVAKMSAN